MGDYYIDYTRLINCFWCVIITMTTVGYGDYYPKTTPGRCIIFITAITGVLILSMLMLALSKYLEMEDTELKSNNVMERLEKRKQLKEEAKIILGKTAKITKKIKEFNLREISSVQKQKHKENLIAQIKLLKKHLNNFRQLNRNLKNSYSETGLQEEMARRFQKLQDELNELIEIQLQTKEHLLRLAESGNLNQFNDILNDQNNYQLYQENNEELIQSEFENNNAFIFT
ncbi:hypothetical protein PPERSA_08074 [Pseudocohnilembus persalinus]|uniref:Potassium channel domain-containing protein n=1 Tax=Pseudocohnilembus persalinus TaxID=266149 RepID=A0A0V0R2R2_PSEPJ|nr:hypothetical protein PPERSA_08074 [Pseudocohnilembus persalinus]|eukprot:KRX08763.1 hypothetical protein PPERSA_08074 [Pseudocohnilembus persalinus]